MKTRKFVSKNLPPVPVFFNEPESALQGWCEGQPGVGRVIGVKSVRYSDGSSVRWYRMAAVKKKKLSNTRKNFNQKRVTRNEQGKKRISL
jgi:hypothetical protein